MKIEVKNLCGGYGSKKVLENLSFSIPEHKISVFLGPNGCGKSTLLKMIGRLLKPSSGEILADGLSVWKWNTLELARKMAILPQFHTASGELTVEEIVSCGRFPHKTSRKKNKEVIQEVLELTGLIPLRSRTIGTLSGGERQRAWIAMSIAQEPEILLLDEPMTYLDVRCQFEIAELIRKLNQERGITIAAILHDINMASSCAHQLFLMKQGRIPYTGTPGELMKPEILQNVFGIETQIIQTPGKSPYCIATGAALTKQH